MEILAVDQRVEAPTASKVDVKELRSVTLLVTPEQAAKLDMGQNAGTLHLSLRNPEDKVETTTRPATLAELKLTRPPAPVMKEQPRQEVAPQPPSPAVILTLHGTVPGAVELRK
jgi:Flp pilus assembly protein CpaB